MFRIIASLITVVFTCGISIAQEDAGPNFQHLKPYGPMLGTWRYEGPLLEDFPGVAEKGTILKSQFRWRRILNKNVVEETWQAELEGGKTFSGKALIGWNAADMKLSYGGMDSIGGMSLGTVTFDKKAKTSTLTEKGIDGEGNETTFKAVVTITGKDTLTWQALERSGGIFEGPSPIYAFNKVQRTEKTAN